MTKFSEEEQIMLVSKVLKEMEKAEDNILLWNSNACWYEKYTASYIPKEYFNYPNLLDDEEVKKIDFDSICDSKQGIPLRKVSLTNEIGAEISEISWLNIASKKATRDIVFKNNGDIFSSKKGLKKGMLSYECMFNVLSNDFSITFKNNENNITLKLEDNTFIIVYNGITIIQDLLTKTKKVFINRDNIKLEAIYEHNRGLKRGYLEIRKLNNRKNKINRTYKYIISKKKGLSMNCYSRKGNKQDMILSPYKHIVDAHLLLEQEVSSKTSNLEYENRLLTNFEKLFLNARNYKIRYGNGYTFNGYGFTIDLKTIEDKALELLKDIKGEVLLTGLTDRINNCINALENPLFYRSSQLSIKPITKRDEN